MYPLLPKNMLFETLITLVLVFGPLYIFFRVNNLYKLAKHRSIKSFGYSYLFFSIGFLARYMHNLFDTLVYNGNMPVALEFISMFATFYFPLLGTLYLSYAFIWRKIESERLHKSPHGASVGTVIKQGIALAVSLITVTSIIVFKWTIPVLFYLTAIVTLSYPIFLSERKKKGLDAFSISIGGGFIIFLLLLFADILQNVTGYGYTITWIVTTLIVFIIVMKVQKLTK